jgi:purine catabolism regulator
MVFRRTTGTFAETARMTPGRIVEFAEELGRIAAGGGGVAALTAHLAQAAQATVLVEDAQWHNLAAAGAASAPATARDLFDAANLENRMPRRHRNGRPGLSISLLAGQTLLGWLSIFASADADIDAFARLGASAIALELIRDRSPGTTRRRLFWERLLDGAHGSASAARNDAAGSGIDLAPHYVVITLEAAAADGGAAEATDALRKLAGAAFHASETEVGVVARNGRLVVIVPARREVDAENTQTAATLLPKTALRAKNAVRFCGGVSPAAAAADVPRAFGEAETALEIARRVFGDGRVAAYRDLGIYPLLFEGAGVEALRTFAREALAPLREYDEKHQSELERTLRIYFSAGQNVKTASATLNVHRHTVFYRLRQISEITGRSFDDAHDQLTLRLAIAIDALHTI